MKRLFLLLLAFVLMLSLAGCAPVDFIGELFNRTEPAEPMPIPSEFVPVTENPEPTEESISEPTELSIPEVTVSDAFVETLTLEDYDGSSYINCYHIPQFEIHTPEVEQINANIYSELYQVLERNVYEYPEQPNIYSMTYEWIQQENIVSLLVSVGFAWGMEEYYVYNVYADGSGEVSNEELWSYYGFDELGFYDLVARKLEEKYLSSFKDYPSADTDPFYQQQLANTIAYDNVRAVVPYISEGGDLCCIATIYSLAGADAYDRMVNLSGTEELPWPECDIHHE